MVEREVLENHELNQIAENVDKLDDAVTCVKEYEKIIQSEKQNVKNIVRVKMLCEQFLISCFSFIPLKSESSCIASQCGVLRRKMVFFSIIYLFIYLSIYLFIYLFI